VVKTSARSGAGIAEWLDLLLNSEAVQATRWMSITISMPRVKRC